MRKTIALARLGVACIGLLGAYGAGANTWDFEGVVETCDPLACSLAGIGVGDPLTGFLTADDAASGPNSTFTVADILDYSIVVQGLGVGPDDSDINSASATTDGDGELVAGSLEFFGVFDAGALGLIDLTVTIDLDAGTWAASTEFLSLGEVASGSLAFSLEPDDDDVPSIVDNCTFRFNPDQIDSDGDLHGNACDGDLNNDCSTDFPDLELFKGLIFMGPGAGDLSGDGNTDFVDLQTLKALFFAPPGPSANGLCTVPL